MKFIISIAIMMLLSFCVCLFFPWWCIALVAFAVSVLIPQSHIVSFFTGFTALFLLWGVTSFIISTTNDGILAHRVSLLIFKTDNAFLLILATALIGGLVAGVASLTGSYLRIQKSHI